MHSLNSGDNLKLTQCQQWKENRLKPGQSFVGLAVSEGSVQVTQISRVAHMGTRHLNRGTYSCTSNGALRLTKEDELQHSLAVLPTRLCCWRLSSDDKSFVYGGEEVEVSLWDTERAFSHPITSTPGSSQKRKRGGSLLPAETWRAKNVSSWVRWDELRSRGNQGPERQPQPSTASIRYLSFLPFLADARTFYDPSYSWHE